MCCSSAPIGCIDHTRLNDEFCLIKGTVTSSQNTTVYLPHKTATYFSYIAQPSPGCLQQSRKKKMNIFTVAWFELSKPYNNIF
jgi:hypothetical protein